MTDPSVAHPTQLLHRRAFLRLAGLGVAAVGLAAACAPTTTTPTPAQPSVPTAVAAGQAAPAQSAAGAAVKFWHVWGGDRQPLIEKVIADFQARTPNVKVEHTVLSQQGLQEKSLTAIAGGEPPDVLMLSTRDLPNFASHSALRGVDDLIQRDKLDLKSTFYPGEVQTSTYQGKLYGLPLTAGGAGSLVFWNKAHFREVGLDPDKAPRTWAEFADASGKLTKVAGGNVERVGSLYWISDNNWHKQWAYSNAASLYSEDGMKVMFDSRESVEALKYMLDNLERDAGGYERVRSFATQPGPGGAEGNQSFFQGKLSMHLNGVFHFLQLEKEAPTLEYGVGVFPFNDQNPAAKPVQNVDGVWNYIIPKGARSVDGAWELIKYTTAGQGQADFFKAQGRPSVVPKYNEDPEYTKANKFWPVVQDALKQTRALPVTPVYAEDMKILAQYTEEALLKKRSAEEALHMATLEAQKVHDEKLKA